MVERPWTADWQDPAGTLRKPVQDPGRAQRAPVCHLWLGGELQTVCYSAWQEDVSWASCGCTVHRRTIPFLLLSQDVVAGDGTTSVVVICGALLKKCQELLEKGVHPTIISDSFNKAANKACEVCIKGCG